MASIASPARSFPNSGFQRIDNSQKIDEEKFPDYLEERYYPVRIGESFNSRYQVITKLGFGAGSTVWLCRDLVEHRFLTLKVNVRSRRANPEILLSEHMKSIEEVHGGEKYVRRVIDSFDVDGPHGTHCCLLYEPAGIDINEFIHRLEGGALSEHMLRMTVRFILIALDYLHQLNVVHTDVQPNNILLGIEDDSILAQMERDELETPGPRKQISQDRFIYLSRSMPLTRGEPLLSDMGEARLSTQGSSMGKHTGLIMPTIYRAPEVMLGLEWDSKVDIWALGQTIWTIFERGHLFDNVNPGGELDHSRRFAEMISLMGPPPSTFLKQSDESHKYWDENGNWKNSYPIPEQSLESREVQLTGPSQELFLRFMRKMLQWDPEDRASAQQLLFEDEWVSGGEY
ncbi:hypothetical protein FQN54_008133 [Arachnomyces sp. PD_36]|nr:hypothetical protein FQN54_008133 [Arachnomyces sp. PD_36]